MLNKDESVLNKKETSWKY